MYIQCNTHKFYLLEQLLKPLGNIDFTDTNLTKKKSIFSGRNKRTSPHAIIKYPLVYCHAYRIFFRTDHGCNVGDSSEENLFLFSSFWSFSHIVTKNSDQVVTTMTQGYHNHVTSLLLAENLFCKSLVLPCHN